MDKESLKQFVGMIQLALDKIQEIIEEDEQSPICVHPLNARRDMSTMGNPSWQCKNCGYIYEKHLEESDDGKVCSE
jgi:ribosomal protein L37AE/L43A